MSRDDGALAHAWAYFNLHASQRITIFNYFVVFSGILTTGLAAAIQAPPRLAVVGVALGLLLCLLSFLFWQLDRRTSFLIKHAEDAIKLQEPVGAQLMTEEVVKTADAKQDEGLWTYGKVFRSIFLVMAIVGLAGAIVSGLRGSGRLSWEDPKPPRQLARPDCNGEPAPVQTNPRAADVAAPEVRTPERPGNAERQTR